MQEKKLPRYNEQTTKHINMLKHYTSEISKNGSKVLNQKFNSFLGKNSINDLSSMGNKYCDFVFVRGPLDSMYVITVKAEIALIDSCLQKGILPKTDWFKAYHAQYESIYNSVSGYDTKDLLLSSELVSWLNDKTQSPEKMQWLEFVPKDELALKKVVKKIDFFPTPLKTIKNNPFYKKNIF